MSGQPRTFRESGLLTCVRSKLSVGGENVLSDYERKVLRILYNYSVGRRRFPTIHELTVKTGKYKADVMAALDALTKANYIQWDDKADATKIVILEGWEREVERPKVDSRSTTSSSANMDYWTQY